MTTRRLHRELTDAISLFDADAIERILAQMPRSELNAVPNNLTHLAYAVDVIEDAFVQSGTESSMRIIHTLIAAGADPDGRFAMADVSLDDDGDAEGFNNALGSRQFEIDRDIQQAIRVSPEESMPRQTD